MQPCEDLRPVLEWLRSEGKGYMALSFSDERPSFLVQETVDLERLKQEVPLPKHVLPSGDKLNGEGGLICLHHRQTIYWPAEPYPEPPPCEHLLPVMEALLQEGNAVVSKWLWPHRFTWAFRDWVDVEALRRRGLIAPPLHHWSSSGPHSLEAEALTCTADQLTIWWPLREQQDDRLRRRRRRQGPRQTRKNRKRTK